MPINTERAQGERFVVNLSYTEPSGRWKDHPSYREITLSNPLAVGRFIPPQENDLIRAIVNTHRITALEVADNLTGKSHNILGLLPARWRIVAITFPQEMFAIMRYLGQDMKAPQEQGRLAVRLPLFVFSDRLAISLPLYRLRRPAQGIDETVEQLVYCVGVSHAHVEGTRKQREAFIKGREFLRETLGGPLMIDKIP